MSPTVKAPQMARFVCAGNAAQRRKRVRQHQQIIAGVIRVQLANFADMVADPNGPYPACKNAVGTWICERCWKDVRENRLDEACSAIPREKRWRFKETPMTHENCFSSATLDAARATQNPFP